MGKTKTVKKLWYRFRAIYTFVKNENFQDIREY
jgi:hypothetical protein